MAQNIDAVLKALKRNNFDVRLVQTAVEARDMILEMIPLEATVGVADSVTLRQTGALDELSRRGNEVINPFRPEMTDGMAEDRAKLKRFIGTIRKTFTTDVFLTGSNAVTEDGKIVNIDGAGNRVAGIIYAAPKVILTIGTNKIVKDVDAALDRIKNVICPIHAKQKQYNTPCAVTGKCNDCNSKKRICSVTVIMEKKPYLVDLSVILIDDDLGLGFDPVWDEHRVKEIIDSYYAHSWPF